MTRDAIELAMKVGAAVGLAALHPLLWLGTQHRSVRSIERTAWATWLATRVGPFVLLFGALGLPVTSDAARQYLPQGLAVLRGELVYRDFPSSYGPLFPYAVAALIAFVRKPEVLVLAAIGFEALAMRAWSLAVASSASERARAQGLLLYACSPIAVWTTAVAGHNQSWLSFALALAFAALARAAYARSAIIIVLGAAWVKALAVAAAPYVMFVAARSGLASGRRAGLAFALTTLAVLAPFSLLGAPIWMPITREGSNTTSGNLPFVLGALGFEPVAFSRVLLAVLALSVLAASAFAARRATGPRFAHHAALCAVMLVAMIVSKKAYTTYLVVFWLPMCFVIAGRGSLRTVLVFALLSVVATLEPALWFDWLHQRSLARALDMAVLGDGLDRLKLSVFIACELALLAGYAWLLREAARALVPSGASEVSS